MWDENSDSCSYWHNVNPDPINYPIPGNDDSITSIEYFLKEIIEAYSYSYLKAGEAKAKEVTKIIPCTILKN